MDGVPIPGQTGPTYTWVAGDLGKITGCAVTGTNSAGSETVVVAINSPVASSYPLADPVILVAPTLGSFGGTAAPRQVETASFTASNKPIMVLYHFRGGASTDATATITVGTPGRVFGTGTGLTFVGRLRRTSAQTLAYAVLAPGSGTVTVQCETVGMDTICHRVEVIELGGAASFVAGTQAGGTTVSSLATSTTTGVANTIVLHTCNRFSGVVTNPITTAGATEISNGNTGGTSATADLWVATAWEQVPVASAAAANFTWPTAATVGALSIEVRP